MTAIDALAACPFCGKSERLKLRPYMADDDGGEPFPWGFTVQCSASGFDNDPRRGCGAQGGWGETEADAIAAWNRRALSAPSSREARQSKLADGLKAARDSVAARPPELRGSFKSKPNDAVIAAVADLVGDLTGMVPPPVDAFPEHMRPAVDRFSSRVLSALTSPVERPAEEGWHGQNYAKDARRLIDKALIEGTSVLGGPEGETIIGYTLPHGVWLMLQAAVRNLLDTLPAAPTPSDPFTEGMRLRKEADDIRKQADAKMREAYDADSAADDIGREERP